MYLNIFKNLYLGGFMFSLFYIALAVLIIAVNMYFSEKEKNTFFVLETTLKWLILILIGIGGVIVFMMHTFNSDAIAKQIGWATGSPFQLEVGAANLAIAVLGIISYWQRKMFWLATVIAYAVFLYGAAGVHINEMMNNNNYAQYNSGFFLWFSDIIVPTILLILVFFYLKAAKSNSR